MPPLLSGPLSKGILQPASILQGPPCPVGVRLPQLRVLLLGVWILSATGETEIVVVVVDVVLVVVVMVVGGG